jgi:hypothetical protein
VWFSLCQQGCEVSKQVSHVHLVQDLESLHLILLLQFFSKKEKNASAILILWFNYQVKNTSSELSIFNLSFSCIKYFLKKVKTSNLKWQFHHFFKFERNYNNQINFKLNQMDRAGLQLNLLSI